MSPESVARTGVRVVTEPVVEIVALVGKVTMLYGDMIRSSVSRVPPLNLVIDQMNAIGVGSLGLALVVSLFTGAVAAVQAAYQFTAVVPLKFLSAVILRSTVIELGPVLTALVVGGRVGASIAAELGSMKVTEQIDAMRSMGVNPVRVLIVPRVVAATVMLPVIVVFADAIGIFGGFVVAVLSVGVSPGTYVSGLKDFFFMKDLMSGLLKAVVFGNIIGTMGCYFGFATEGGAEGVGAATTRAVVASCVLVLMTDYVLATVLFRIIFKE